MKEGWSPDAVQAAPYVASYAAFLAVIIAVRTLLYFWVQSSRTAPVPRYLGPYDVSMLMNGLHRVVETGIAGLIDSGAVAVSPRATEELRPRPDAHQRARDPVQRQLLALLPSSANFHVLAWKFLQTPTYAHVRHGLVSAGFMHPRRGRVPIGWFFHALVLLGLVATIAAQSIALGKVSVSLLFFAPFAAFFTWLFSETTLPLTHTRAGKQLRKKIWKVQNKHLLRGLEHEALQRARSIYSAHAQEWGVAPGWFESAVGMVPVLGWSGYRDRWGERFDPLEYWSPFKGIIKRTPGQHRGLGLLYRVLGVICGLTAPVSIAFFPGTGNPLFVVLGVALIGGGVRLATTGRKHRADHGPERLFAAGRPPVLYLRSFAHDSLLEKVPPFRSIFAALGSRNSYIEEVVRAVRPFGHVVTIANPGEPLPGLGPAAIHVAQTESDAGRQLSRWQAEVLNIMHSSSLVLISAGRGEGLRWEFAQATSHVAPEKLVILVPLNRADYERFQHQTGAYFRRGLPADPRKPDRKQKNEEPLHGLIYFDPDWTPHFVQFRFHPLAQLHLGRIAIRPSLRAWRNRIIHALYPVFRNNPARWPGVAIPVPFGRRTRYRVVPGVSLKVTLAIAVIGPSIAQWVSTASG